MLSGCSNFLEPMAGKSTDEALFEDAKKLADDQDYAGALEKYDQMSSGFTERRDVKVRWAGALAGKCGLNFFDYTEQLANASLGASTFFKYLMNAWTGEVVDPESCKEAETKIKEVWATQSAEPSEQFFMAILSMVKIGTYLRDRIDVNGAGGLGDGNADSQDAYCKDTSAGGALSDADVKEVVTGFSLFLMNIVGFSSSLSSDMRDALDDINTACGALNPNPCATIDTSGVTGGMVTSMRRLLDMTGFGVGACVPVDPATLAPCCP
jgi:hypothetical protein